MEGLIALVIGATVSCIVFLILTALNRQSSLDHTEGRPSKSDPPVRLRGHTTESASTPPSPAPETETPQSTARQPPPSDPPALSRVGAAESASPQPSTSLETKTPPISVAKPIQPERPAVPAWHAWSLPSSDLKITPPATPKCVTFFDVETTGLNTNDRIITLAAIKLLNPETCATRLEAEFMHLIFDPGRKSHPKAEAVHGYSDWVLRHQDTFDIHAETIQKFFNSSDLVVAHNAEFDLAFYNREMERTGRSPLANGTFCTMSAYQQRGFPGSASLDAICHRMGIARASRQHGALEDAWLALRVYLWLKNVPFSAPLPPDFQRGPSNLRPAPQLPDGPLPRRRRKRIANPLKTSSTGDGSVPPSLGTA
jgi:DNA polymerase-3 subunit epsilon